MQRALFLAFLGLLSSQAIAESPAVDKCSKMCMRYQKCMENHANGLPDAKTCFEPPCNCGPKPVKPESEMCEGGPCPKVAPIIDEIVHRCDMVCLRYSKCRAEGRKPCMMPGRCRCFEMQQPESKMCDGGPCPKAAPIVDDFINRCDTMCLRYSECRAQGNEFCMMPPGCKCAPLPQVMESHMCDGGPCPKAAPIIDNILTNRCVTMCKIYSECRAQGKEFCMIPEGCQCLKMPQMAVDAKAMPCVGPQCQPEDDSNMPLRNFCNDQCNLYKKCRGENNPSVPCIPTPGCLCEPMDEKSKMLIPPPPSDQCMEPCKAYWQCRIGGVGTMEKPHLTCPKPSGCRCDCMTAGVCDQADVAKMRSKVIEPVPAAERCAIQYCAQYWNCQVEKLGRPDKQLLNCLKPFGCKCECLDEGICLREHFIPDQVDVKPMSVPVLPMCSNEKCADFWKCNMMAMQDKKLACVMPMGCNCDSKRASEPEIIPIGSGAGIIPSGSGGQFVWPPRVVPMHDMRCTDDCAKFRLCNKLFGSDKCKVSNNCNC